jgi:hypothetical protein
VDAAEFVEDFLISAVASILLFRVVLHLTGYPSLGGEAIHIAHMLPGGLLMLVALLLLFGYLGAGVKRVAAIVGGVGFGTFIDELGKLITRDSDYFFKPTAALIYLILVAIYLAFRTTRRLPLTREESVANALELLVEAIRHDLDPDEKARALELLRHGDRASPMVATLEEAFRRIHALQTPRPGVSQRARARLRASYRRLLEQRWFAGAVIAFFVVQAVVTLVKAAVIVHQLALAAAVLVAALLLGVAAVRAHRVGKHGYGAVFAAVAIVVLGVGGAASLGRVALPELSFFQWGEMLSSAAPGAVVLAGIFQLGRSWLSAYRMFQRAVLIQIFVTQFFAFYHAEFVAAVGLLVNLVVFAALRYMIHQEESSVASDRARSVALAPHRDLG